MNKFCVFCGEKPKSKNKEHILPRWLLELTGDPNRAVFLGYKFDIKGFPKRSFSIDSFQFPACSNCNQEFSNLEDSTKNIFLSMFSGKGISENELSTLFDWFDKVRVGLWLAYYYLDKNITGIKPKFHIKERLGAYDRHLRLYRIKTERKKLTFIGVTTPFFYYTPSCFSLIVNNFYFMNVSSFDLFSRRLGFPFAGEQFMNPGHFNINCTLQDGRNRVMLPLIKKQLAIKCVELYQPMFKNLIDDPEVKDLFLTDYVRFNSIAPENGIGGIFISENKLLKRYSKEPTLEWLPKDAFSPNAVTNKFIVETLEFQNYLNANTPSLEHLSEPDKSRWRKQVLLCKRSNDKLIKQYSNKSVQ